MIISLNSNEEIRNEIIKQINIRLRKLSEKLNINVSVSIGTSFYPEEAKTLDALLHTADLEMYEMKNKTIEIQF